MSTPVMTKHEMDCVDDTILEQLIIELGLKKHHMSPDPLCFICRQEHYNLNGNKIDHLYSKHCMGARKIKK